MQKVYCVTGIDTEVGKTVVTGALARWLKDSGIKVTTQKIAQTGCTLISSDIIEHRAMMGESLTQFDLSKVTCPYVFPKPASPHLSAEECGCKIDLDVITASTDRLLEEYSTVILEGAGGVLVPLTRDVLFLDYVAKQGYDLIIVTTPRLGSVNHTLLTIEAAVRRNISISAVVYNCIGDYDLAIMKDTQSIILKFLEANNQPSIIIEMPRLEKRGVIQTDFSPIFI
ncbi:MAG: dethiobiotin synthase [Lentisphaeria bacterium]